MEELTRRRTNGEESYPPSVEFVADHPFSRFALCHAVAARAKELYGAWRGVPFRVTRNPVEVVVQELLAGKLRIQSVAEEEPERVLAQVAYGAEAPEEMEEEEELQAA